MKALFISFNQAHYEAILDIMDRNNIKGFTYWDGVAGRGSRGGEPHYGDHAWATLNGAIWSIVEDEKADRFLRLLHKLDKTAENQGLRAFVLNVEKTI
jgi:nitrogen regulatory protein PII